MYGSPATYMNESQTRTKHGPTNGAISKCGGDMVIRGESEVGELAMLLRDVGVVGSLCEWAN